MFVLIALGALPMGPTATQRKHDGHNLAHQHDTRRAHATYSVRVGSGSWDLLQAAAGRLLVVPQVQPSFPVVQMVLVAVPLAVKQLNKAINILILFCFIIKV